jgi:secreted Zn-dependent insulinase-like peptidase
LKTKGFVESVIANYNNEEGIFFINFTLTKEGINNIEYIDGTLKYTLNTLFSLKWNKIIDYYSKLYELNFNNMNKIESIVLSNRLAINLFKYPLESIYSSEFLITRFEKNPIQLIQNYFNNCFRVLVIKKDLNNPIIDKYYGTKYAEIKNIDSPPIKYNFLLNLENTFLDMNPIYIKNLDIDQEPFLIRDKTWYGGSSKFNEALILGTIIIGNTNFYSNEKNYLLSMITEKCLTFYLHQELYNILTLNYDFKIFSKISYNSILIEYSCPNDPLKFNSFVDSTIQLIKSFSIPEIIIKTKINVVKEELSNNDHLNPWEYSSYLFSRVSKNNDFMHNDLLKVIDKITMKDVINFISNIFEGSSITSFFYGNLTKDQVPNNYILNKYHFNQLNNLPQIKILKDITIKHPNKNEKNNCLTCIYYIGNFVPFPWLNAFIINLIVERKFYNVLRTEKQLGYLVDFSLSNILDEYFFIEKIQSDKNCDFILNEVNNFNKTILDEIDKCNLNEVKKSAENYLLQQENNTSHLFERYFSEIISRKYLFNRKKMIYEHLSKITKESLKKFTI